MTAWLKLVPPWAWWALALVVVAGGQQVRVVWAQDVAGKAQADLLEAGIRKILLIQDSPKPKSQIEGCVDRAC